MRAENGRRCARPGCARSPTRPTRSARRTPRPRPGRTSGGATGRSASASSAEQAMFLAWDGDAPSGSPGIFGDEGGSTSSRCGPIPRAAGEASAAPLLEAAVAFAGDAEILLSVTDGNDVRTAPLRTLRLRRDRAHRAAALEPLAGDPRAAARAMTTRRADRARSGLRSRPVSPCRGRLLVRRPFRRALADGRTVFVKSAEADNWPGWLRREHEVYAALAGSFMPELVGLGRRWHSARARARGPERRRLGAALGRGRGSTPFARRSPSSLRRSPLHRTPRRSRLPCPISSAAGRSSPRIRRRSSRLGLRDDALARSSASDDSRVPPNAAPVSGSSLCHLDVRSDNLCFRDGRAVLVDWNWASFANPDVDLAAWLPSVRVEGGPAPWEILPDAASSPLSSPASGPRSPACRRPNGSPVRPRPARAAGRRARLDRPRARLAV